MGGQPLNKRIHTGCSKLLPNHFICFGFYSLLQVSNRDEKESVCVQNIAQLWISEFLNRRTGQYMII